MMTARSTMIPKSIALTPCWTIPVIANSIDSRITQAVTIAARIFPRMRNTTATTRPEELDLGYAEAAASGLAEINPNRAQSFGMLSKSISN